MATFTQEIAFVCVLLALGYANGQHQQVAGGQDKQIRLEDIERDNLNSQAHKEQVGQQLTQNAHPAAASHQQQIAAYQQQQFYLQQLQQQQLQQQQQVAAVAQQQAQAHPGVVQPGAPHQVIVPQQVPYNTVPIMFIQQPALVDQLAQYYLMQQQLAALQYQPVAHTIHPQALAHPGLGQIVPQQVVHILPQQIPQAPPQVPQSQRPQQNNKPFRPSPPLAPAQPRPQTQTLVYTQQHYNPYNTIYQQQQQQKFLSGVKSTPAPPLKESQAPIQQATQYATFKSF